MLQPLWSLILLKLCLCVCCFFNKIFNHEADKKTAEIRHGCPISIWLSNISGYYYCCCYYYYSMVDKNWLRKWELGGLGSLTFSLLVNFYQRLLLIISNWVNHCDLSTVKDMWVMTISGLVTSWLTKVVSKLSKGSLLFGRDWIFSQTLKHGGVFKLLLAS